MDMSEKLEQVAGIYRGQGYNVSVQPGPDQLPPFAKDFRVEIVAHRGAEGVLVAVRKNRDEVAADTDMQRYAEVTGTQPGWRFDFAVLEGTNPRARDLQGAREFSDDDISHSLEDAGELNRMHFFGPAVIVAWSALEAAMRMRLRALGQEAGWGSIPRQMLTELYSEGALSPNEFDRIEKAFQIRSRIVHGFEPQPLNAGDSDSLVQLLSEVARRLVSESRRAEQAA